MTKEQAKENQDRLSEKYNLSYWYGTNCEKCCGVFPKFKNTDASDCKCWYECEVCGKRTRKKSMPWEAEEAWNAHEYDEQQISMF